MPETFAQLSLITSTIPCASSPSGPSKKSTTVSPALLTNSLHCRRLRSIPAANDYIRGSAQLTVWEKFLYHHGDVEASMMRTCVLIGQNQVMNE